MGGCAGSGDIVITSNGGYPLDQNLYQSPKAAATAQACCRDGNKLDIGGPGRADHILVNGVVLQHAGDGVWAGDRLVGVVFVDGGRVANTRQDRRPTQRVSPLSATLPSVLA